MPLNLGELIPLFKFPPTEEEREKYFGNNFINIFCRLFNKRVSHSPNFDKLALHVITGQIPNIKRIRYSIDQNPMDLRIHGVLFQDSGSTKGMGFNYTGELAHELGMTYETSTDFTANALVGQPAYITEGKGKDKKKIQVTEPGYLHEAYNNGRGVDILASNEASSIFDNSQVDMYRNSMLYLQVAMNTMGTLDNVISRKTGYGQEPIKTSSNTSMLFTTYYPERLIEVIVRRGFLQRMVIVANDVTKVQRHDTMRHSNKAWNNPIPAGEDKRAIISVFKCINEKYSGINQLQITKQARRVADIYQDDLENEMKGVINIAEKKLWEFAPRYNDHIKRIAQHHAIFRLSDIVEEQDMVYAGDYILPLWRNIVILIESGLDLPPAEKSKRYTEAIEIVETFIQVQKQWTRNALESGKDPHKDFDPEECPRYLVRNALMKKWKKTQPTVDAKINELVQNEVFEQRIGVRHSYFIKLLRRPYLGE